MTARDRFIKSVIASSQAHDIQMPWTRGEPRRKTIARRNATVALPRRAKLASG